MTMRAEVAGLGRAGRLCGAGLSWRPAVLLGTVLLLSVACNKPSRPGPDRATLKMRGQVAPALQLTGWVNSDGLDLEELRGKVVLLDFWGVWCPPCVELIPHLIELHQKYLDDGLVIIGVHTELFAEDMPRFVRRKKIPYSVGIDAKDATAEAYKVFGYPEVYLIGRDGTIRLATRGNALGEIEQAVVELLREQE